MNTGSQPYAGLLLVLLSFVSQLRAQPFTLVLTSLPGVENGAVAWGDYDNDGDLDLVLSGSTGGGTRVTDIYRNDGLAGFVALNAGIPGVAESGVDWGDYDNDGDLDLAIVGNGAIGAGAITRVYRNNGNGTFQDINAGFPSVFRGFIAWVDYNNDGLLDLSFRGPIANNEGAIYRNQGGGTFVRAVTALPPASDGSGSWTDVDNDGDHDLLLTSMDTTGTLTRLLRNREGSFTEFASGLPNLGRSDTTAGSDVVRNAGHAWGDFDQDGVVDALLWGWELNRNNTYIYRGRGDGRFTQVTGLDLPAVTAGAVAWGDYNSDSYLDFALTGIPQPGGLYRNQGDGSFLEDTFAPAQVGRSMAAWGDYDIDGDLDLLLCGRSTNGPRTFLYRNNATAPPPQIAAPSSPATTVLPDNYFALTWDPPAGHRGFTYNIRLGTSPGAIDRASPHSHLLTGRRRIARLGNAGHTNRWLLINLPLGTYYWSVQAIGPDFVGSPFSAEASFTVTNTRPTISQIPAQVTYPNRPTNPIAFTIGDLETTSDELVLSAVSTIPALVSNEDIVFGGGGSARTVTITPRPNQRGTTEIIVVVTDGGGGTARVSFPLQVSEFTWVSAPLLSSFNGGSASWADFDRDDDLDLFVNGSSTLLYRNDGANAFTLFGGYLASMGYGSSAAGDYDNDGDIDFASMGTAGGGISFYQSELYQNLGNNLFTNRLRIPQVGYGSVQWADYDADGDLDLLQIGQYQHYANPVVSFILRNDNGTGFTVFSNYVAGAAYGIGLWGDFDKDSFPDIFISGSSNAFGIQSAGPGATRLYRNNRNGTFAEVATTLPQLGSSAAALGDYDNDGDLDIALCGFHQTIGPMTRLYRNDGAWTFTLAATNFVGVSRGSVSWADYDNDDDLDLLVCGSMTGDFSSATTRLYRNSGIDGFVEIPVILPFIDSGTAAWADYDDDGDLDIVLHGRHNGGFPFAGIYQNHFDPALSDIPAPSNLATEVLPDNSVSLFWTRSRNANDTFNVSVRKSDGTPVVPAQANAATGRRYVAEAGNAGHITHKRLRQLPRGTYNWYVQAIDMRHHGSPFSTNNTFVIDSPLPPSSDAMPNIVVNEDAPPQSRLVTGISAGDASSQNLSLTAYHTNFNLFANIGTQYISPRSTGQVNFVLLPNANGRGYIHLVVTALLDGNQPMSATNTVVVDVLPVNDRPVALFQTVTNVEDSPLQILLSGSDIDGDSLTYSIVTPPDFGSLSGSPPFLVYRPVTNYFGGDRLWFRVNDGVTNSDANAVNIVLAPVRDVENVVTFIERLPNGQLQLTIRGEPYQEYVLETCQNLRDWHHLQNVTGTASGQMTITFGMGDVYRFYRARSAQ